MLSLGQFWLDKYSCDFFLSIDVACADDSSRRHTLARVPAHKVVLAAASEFFATLLSPTWSSAGCGDSSAGCGDSSALCGDNSDGCGGDSSAADTTRCHRAYVCLASINELQAMLALLKCIYLNDLDLDGWEATLVSGGDADTLAGSGCGCVAAAHALRDTPWPSSGACWQALCLRVLALADRFGLAGPLGLAAAKLSRLFSHELSGDAVLSVLWLPGSLAAQPQLRELRAMALNRIVQDAKHVDPVLAHPDGAGVRMLQQLPAAALAELLASDALALTSEDSLLVAIDVWLAGPVARELAAAAADDGTQLGDAASATMMGGRCSGGGACNSGSSESSTSIPALGDAESERGHGGSAGSDGGGRLAAALQLLLRQVRLPLCSGAFLAAAARRPWLCCALQGLPGLTLMRQYYSSDAHARYALAMTQLRAGERCPWSVMQRRGLPSSLSVSNSSILSMTARAAGTAPAVTGLSQIRALLEGGGGRGILLREQLLAGYVWRLELVAAPLVGSSDDDGGSACGGAGRHMQLCLRVSCRPAWADVLCGVDDSGGGSSCSVFGGSTAVLQCSGGGDNGAACCDACAALRDIAATKSAEAVTRHAPLPSLLLHGAAARSSSGGGGGALDIVVGVQLAAAPSAELLQQLVAGVPDGGGNQRPPPSHMPCLLAWDERAGAAGGLLAVDIGGIGAARNLLGVPDAAAAAATLQLPGWQPERWSAAAPAGQLWWHAGLQVLLD